MYQDSKGRKWIRTSSQINRSARQLRQQMTPAEQMLWKRLHNRQVAGLKFRRQQAFGPYIFDFFCSQLKLVIELDGAIHNDPIERANDAERDAQCRAHGLTVLRFTNDEVFYNIEGIIQAIVEIYHGPHPQPLSQ